MNYSNLPTIGLALSGSGNRSSFYIGFFEVAQQHGLKIDFISATSGGSLVALAYACGTLKEFKERILHLTSEDIRTMISRGGSGGIYSLSRVELELRNLYTKGLTFEEVRPHMSFVTADIDTGDLVDLCMGDIARAACASCTLPGVFEPMQWGNRTLVDGGILNQVPLESLERYAPDITIGINMRGAKNIFSNKLVSFKKALNFFKKIFFIGELDKFLDNILSVEDSNEPKVENAFAVIGKSLDIVIKSAKKQATEQQKYDLMIIPEFDFKNRTDFSPEISQFCYEEGKKTALLYLPKIQELIKAKTSLKEVVSASH